MNLIEAAEFALTEKDKEIARIELFLSTFERTYVVESSGRSYERRCTHCDAVTSEGGEHESHCFWVWFDTRNA